METQPRSSSSSATGSRRSSSDSDESYFERIITQGREFNSQPDRTRLGFSGWIAFVVAAFAISAVFFFSSSSSARPGSEPMSEHRLIIRTYATPLGLTSNAADSFKTLKHKEKKLRDLRDGDLARSVLHASRNGTLSRTPGIEELVLTLSYTPEILNNSAERVRIGAALGCSVSIEFQQVLSVVQDAASRMPADPERALEQLDQALDRVQTASDTMLKNLDSNLLEPQLERAAEDLDELKSLLEDTACMLDRHHKPPKNWVSRIGYATYTYVTGHEAEYEISQREVQELHELAAKIGEMPLTLRTGKQRLTKYRAKLHEQPLVGGEGWTGVVDLRMMMAKGNDDEALRCIAANYVKLLEGLDRMELKVEC
ncbi:hypothetical protein IWX49DRAFT_386297 [Phyllosticta citricarpa]|uniref:Uncharacterized protein n=1 Tax=Phyllosticta paracitricarpa TaxID=2016321 RepID=A0ABR1MSL7_9PEZI